MQTCLTSRYLDTPDGKIADTVLRSCVHCGLCTGVCPTYQLTGDELEGPRGRIYLMKQLFEGQVVTEKTRARLDHCLTCRACETACPSQVEYGKLLDLGREVLEQTVPRTPRDAAQRRFIRAILPYRSRFAVVLKLARWLRPLLPAPLRRKIPPTRPATGNWPAASRQRTVLLVEGCVQPELAPGIDRATARILDRLGIQTLRTTDSGCCGALSYHLAHTEEACGFMRRNIDAWWPAIEAGAEAIVSTASGCGLMIRDYGWALRNDSLYAERARRVSALVRDIGEILAAENLDALKPAGPPRIAFHAPCTLQHGQRLGGVVEGVLDRLGFERVPVTDPHICCGSAGTYSLLQPELSQALLHRKLTGLTGSGPERIATANIGCLTHLQSASAIPVCHWVELLDEA
jgi:glycolate oxidase iron-sulfur subunit